MAALTAMCHMNEKVMTTINVSTKNRGLFDPNNDGWKCQELDTSEFGDAKRGTCSLLP